MDKVKTALARIAGKRVYLDANLFIYFLAKNEHYFPAAAHFLEAAHNRQFFAVTGKAVIAEVMVNPYRVGNPEQIAKFKQFFAQDFIAVVDHANHLFDTASMYAGTRRLGLMDAFHFATALDAGCEAMISNDQKLIRQIGLDVIGLDDLIAN